MRNEQLWHLKLSRGGALNGVFSRQETVCIKLSQREIDIRIGTVWERRNSVQRGFHCPFESARPLRGYSAEQILGICEHRSSPGNSSDSTTRAFCTPFPNRRSLADHR